MEHEPQAETAKLSNHPAIRLQDSDLDELIVELSSLRREMVEAAAGSPWLAGVHPNFTRSARNLVHYLALRRRDVRPLQMRLAAIGLSSLGRAESHVLCAVGAVEEALHRLRGRFYEAPKEVLEGVDFEEGSTLLAAHTDAFFGPPPPGRGVRIMVTMPSEAGTDPSLVRDLLAQGMDCMRINCAHDDGSTWARMAEHLHLAEEVAERSCRIAMDLGGPKLRTGPLRPGPAVQKVKPARDPFGGVVSSARLWLTTDPAGHAPPATADACFSLPAEWLSLAMPGKSVKFVDARDKRRVLRIVDVEPHGVWAELAETAYFVPGMELHHARSVGRNGQRTAVIQAVPPKEGFIGLSHGDRLILTRDERFGAAATFDAAGRLTAPPRIGCTLPAALEHVRAGEAIWFDDGKIGGKVDSVESDHVVVRITSAPPLGAKLRSDKGINLPDTEIRLAALTEKDLADLPFVLQHADIVGLSFANRADDVRRLREQMTRLGGREPAIALKIETRRGFEHLPDMLIEAMHAPCAGIMIARGDLAIECGFERLAEVQEEILWLCEAAHVPVIWATQVLENLSKEGQPSRAEITDAAMSHRAECVMLNKGPYVGMAVRALDDILRRMAPHQTKKRAMLRELHLAHVR